MTYKWMVYGLLAVALSLGTVQTGWAQRTSPDTDRSGTAGSAYLLIPLTARTASLGGNVTGGLADLNGLEATFANPAGLVQNTGTTVLFSRMDYVADIGINYFGVGQRFGNNQLGLTVAAWDFGEIPLQTEENPEITDLNWTATFATVGLTYARIFTDRISAGVTAKVVSERIDDLNSSTVAFDAGMTYIVGESGLRFGVSLKNLGLSAVYGGEGLVRSVQVRGEATERSAVLEAAATELPSLLNFGVTYSRPLGQSAVVNLLGNFRANSYTSDQLSAGLEVGMMNVLFVRGGYDWRNDLDENFFQGWNVGAGLNLPFAGNRLMVDYAYRPTDFFSNVHMITASVTL